MEREERERREGERKRPDRGEQLVKGCVCIDMMSSGRGYGMVSVPVLSVSNIFSMTLGAFYKKPTPRIYLPEERNRHGELPEVPAVYPVSLSLSSCSCLPDPKAASFGPLWWELTL